MKLNYEKPDLEIVNFQAEDQIANGSGNLGGLSGEYGYEEW